MKLTILLRSILFTILLSYGFSVYARPNLLILGDSLSAGYGMQPIESWPALLKAKLQVENLDYGLANVSVSGATTSDCLNALPKLLSEYQPKVVIVALGCNDGLRGYPIFTIKSNLASIIKKIMQANAKVLLIGFKLPSRVGESYSAAFAEIYLDLSDDYDVPLVPFMLEGFATDLAYFQKDELHPNVLAQPIILNNIWPYLRPLL